MDDCMQFFCNIHNRLFIKKGNSYICDVNGCMNKCVQKGPIYDFVVKDISNMWDMFCASCDEPLSIRRFYNEFVYQYLTPIFNDYLIKTITNEYAPGSKLIELGCGEASASMQLLKRKNYYIVVVDNNDKALQGAIHRLKKNNIRNNYFIIKADFYNNQLCFCKHYFDISYNVGTIEHFDDPVKAVRQMARLSKKVICLVPAPSILWKINITCRQLIEKDISEWIKGTYYYSEDQLKIIFKHAGLCNIKTHQKLFFGLPLINAVVGEIKS